MQAVRRRYRPPPAASPDGPGRANAGTFAPSPDPESGFDRGMNPDRPALPHYSKAFAGGRKILVLVVLGLAPRESSRTRSVAMDRPARGPRTDDRQRRAGTAPAACGESSHWIRSFRCRRSPVDGRTMARKKRQACVGWAIRSRSEADRFVIARRRRRPWRTPTRGSVWARNAPCRATGTSPERFGREAEDVGQGASRPEDRRPQPLTPAGRSPRRWASEIASMLWRRSSPSRSSPRPAAGR